MTRRSTAVIGAVIAAAAIAILALTSRGRASHRPVAEPAPARVVQLAVTPSDPTDATTVSRATRSAAGAAATAVAYLTAMDRASSVADMLPRLRQVTAPPFTEDALRAEAVVLTLEQAVQAGGSGVMRSWRLGWQIDSYSPRLARVGVWTMGVAVSPRETIVPDWSTTVCVTRWSADGWRVIGAHTVDGPTPPPPGASAAAIVAFVRSASAFRTFTDAP